jgi:predicted PurR-regulated permease PerM
VKNHDSAPQPLRTDDERSVVAMLRWLLYAIFVVVGWYIVSTLAAILAPILVAFGIAYLLDPVLEWMVKRGISRALGATILLFAFLGAVAGVLAFLIPRAIDQVKDFVDDLPNMLDKVSVWLKSRGVDVPDWKEYIKTPEFKSMVEKVIGPAQDLVTAALGGIFTLLGFLAEALLIPVFAFYFLLDWKNITGRVKKIIPPRRRGKVLEILAEVDDVVAGWVRGQATVTFLLAVLYAIAFSVIGIHLAIPIGLLVGLLTVIPFIGTFVGAAITVGIVLLDWHGGTQLAEVGVTFLILHLLEAAVLTPKITGHKVGLSESAALFAVVAGGKLLGLVGILLAVPIAATCGVLLRHLVRHYEHTEFFGKEEDAIVPVTNAMAMIMPDAAPLGTRPSREILTEKDPEEPGEPT